MESTFMQLVDLQCINNTRLKIKQKVLKPALTKL